MSQGYYPPQPQQGYQNLQQGPAAYKPPGDVVGGWRAADYGMEPGKCIEYEVVSIPTKQRGRFEKVTFFKAYKKKDGTLGQGFGFGPANMRELVERINHYLATYAPAEHRGRWVFEHIQAQPQHVQIPQQGYAQQPAPQYQQGYAPQPQYAQAPQYGQPPLPQGYAPQPAPQYDPQQQYAQAPQQQQPQGAPQQPMATRAPGW